jgi:hypothetical protein
LTSSSAALCEIVKALRRMTKIVILLKVSYHEVLTYPMRDVIPVDLVVHRNNKKRIHRDMKLDSFPISLLRRATYFFFGCFQLHLLFCQDQTSQALERGMVPIMVLCKLPSRTADR